MKIRERQGEQDTTQVSGASTTAADRAKSRKEVAAQVRSAAEAAHGEVEKVQIGLGRSINQELNPSVMAEERRAKIEALKKAIGEGSYSVDSFLVAEKVSEEVNLEIAFAPVFEGGDSTDDDESEKA